MKVGIQETTLSYIVHLVSPDRNLVRAIPKRRVDRAVDPRAVLANELQVLFDEWEITDIVPRETKDRLIREFFAA